MENIDLTSLVELVPNFEEKVGVSLKGISVFLAEDEDGEYINISAGGEVHASKGDNVKEDFSIKIVVYDKNDRVIGTSSTSFDSDDFFGFDAFSEDVDIPTTRIGKIKIFPKKGY